MGSGRRPPLSLTSHHRCQLISPWQLRNLDRNQMDRRWTARSCAANCIWPYYSLSKLGLEGGPRVWEVPPFFNKIATEISPTAPLGSFAAVGNGKWGPAGRRRGDKSCPELKKINQVANEISQTAPLCSFAAVGNGKRGPAGRRRGDKSCPELKNGK